MQSRRCWTKIRGSMEIERVTFDPLTCLQAPRHWKWLYFYWCHLWWLLWPKNKTNPVIEVRYVKDTWLKEQKANHVADRDAPYVSSNDLLTSWFLSVNQTACGTMTIEMRNRMPGLTRMLAGLYTSMLFFYPQEYRKPANIRRAVQRLSHACMPDASQQKPGSGYSCGIVTAWHTFYHHDVSFPGCKHLLHFPITSVWKNYPAMKFPLAVIFRPEAGRLAMCTVTGARLPEDPGGPLGVLLGDPSAADSCSQIRAHLVD